MRPSSEALLISALVNSEQTQLAKGYGVEPEMLVGYQAEYRWVLSYENTYGTAPSKETLLHRFPDFPWADSVDVAFAAAEVIENNNHRDLRRAVRTAASHIAEGDFEEAALALSSFVPTPPRRPATNMLHELAFLDAYANEKPDGLALPWKTLQNLTGGIRPGDLWYWAARLGMGKSWLSTEIATQALLDGRRVMVWSLEMPKEQWLTRVHVALGKRLGVPVDHVAMRDRHYDLIAYRKLVNRIRDEVPGFLDIADATSGVVSPALLAARASDYELHIVDYAGLMHTPMGKRAVDDWRLMAAISNELKYVAAGHKTRILALAQINREGDSLSKYPPKVKNLAQSDALGQDGDVVVTHKRYAKSAQILSLEKNRHGSDGHYLWTRYLPNEGTFHEISQDVADDLRDREDMDR